MLCQNNYSDIEGAISPFFTATVIHRQSSAVASNICDFGPWKGVHVDVVGPFVTHNTHRLLP